MMQTPAYHFSIDPRSDLLADIDVWERALPGVFEPGHTHSYYEILVFKKGGGTHQMAHELFDVADHSVHILKNNNFHELRRTTETDGFEIIFSEVFLEQLQQFDRKTAYIRYFADSHVLNFEEAVFAELQVYFDELIRHRQDRPIFYNLVSLIILKIMSADVPDSRRIRHSSFEQDLLGLLDRHFREKQPQEFYASKLHMSVVTFQRHTKSAFGKSIIELQNERILREVKFLLSRNDKPIKEIASGFSFADESHFNHFFRKHTGVSPSAYRRSVLI